jgi:valyl-tRNA synthetase
LLDKTRTYPVPEKILPKILKGLEKEYPKGIPASGADGLRFSLAALSGQGRDVKLAIPRVAGYRAFLNKVWNATRFAMMRIGPGDIAPLESQRAELSMADRWILSRLQSVSEKVESSIESYRFDEVASAIYQFFWNEFCDWYIELVKTPLMDEEMTPRREAARSVLVHVLDFSMRLMHPLCPYQSEEIWQKLPGRKARWAASGVEFCAVAPFPEVDESWRDEDAERAMGRVIKTVTRIRNLRRESGLPQQKRIPAVLLCDNEKVKAMLASLDAEITRLALLSSLEVCSRDTYEIPQQSALDSEPEVDVVLPLEGVIDLAAERERIGKDLEKARKELEGYRRKLSNEKYLSKAPAEVVEQTRTRATDCEERISSLEAALERL